MYLLGKYLLKFTSKGKYVLAFVHGGAKFGHKYRISNLTLYLNKSVCYPSCILLLPILCIFVGLHSPP